MTYQQLNEAVAKKLGLAKCLDDRGHVWVDEYFQRDKLFDPATDPAAAEWALNRSLPDDTWLHIQWWTRRQGKKVIHTLDINGVVTEGSFCEVICEMILRT